MNQRPVDTHLTRDEFVKIAASLADDEDVFLIGGQALNIWAEYYFRRAPDELAQYSPFTSKDIDYFGYYESARAFAAKIGGHALKPTPDDVTPNTALVAADLQGRTIEIDFLSNVEGVPDRILERNGVRRIEVPVGSGGETTYVELSLLAPLPIFMSRAANIVLLGRRDDTAMRQLKAAMVVLREHILSELEKGETGPVTKTVQDYLAWLKRDRAAHDLERIASIDPLRVLEEVIPAPQWDSRYREKTLAPELEKLRSASKRRSAERTRKLQRE